MGLFGKKKEKAKPQTVNISGEQLCGLLKKAILLAAEDVEAHCYTTGPEIMFEYKDNIHFAGVNYDKKRAKAEKRVSFANELVTLYMDKNIYTTVEELYNNAIIDNVALNTISDGIIVEPEFEELL